jgi:tetratricopeptide (TPR) repeat protein
VLPAHYLEEPRSSSDHEGKEEPLLPPPRRFSPPDKIIATTPREPPPPDPERNLLLAAARNAVARGDWEVAIARFEEVFRRFGDDLVLRREYAGVLVQAGQTERAIRQYKELLEGDPSNVALRVLLGDLHLLLKDYPAAVKQFELALQAQPGKATLAARLARAHFFEGDVARALEVYDRYLAKLRPDEDSPRALGALLLDLGRYQEAIPFLVALLRKDADNSEVLALLVRAHARLGDRSKALDYLQEMRKQMPRSLGMRLELADTLYATGDQEIAREVFQQILQTDGGNGNAVVGLARVELQFFHPAEACRLLKSLTPTETVRRIYRLTWAEYHQAVGEYAEAVRIYKDFLKANANDHEVRFALAELYAFIRDFEKAKSEFARIPPSSPLGRKSRLGFADTLANQWRLVEAADATRCLVAERPADGQAAAQLVRILGKSRQYDEARRVAREYLQANARNELGGITVRFALGKVLLDANQNAEAAGEYEWLLARPGGRITEAYYGLLRAKSRLMDVEKSESLMTAALRLSESESRNRLLLADLFYRDNQDQPAIDMLQPVLESDPQNLSALIRLADAQLRVARFDAQIGPLLATCDTIVRQSPENIRGHLAKARAHATVQDYNAAIGEYDLLISIFPRFLIPRREKARILFSAHEFGASEAAYQAIQSPSAGETLLQDVNVYIQREPRARALLDGCIHRGMPDRILRTEIVRAISRSGDEDVRDSLRDILVDYDALSADQLVVHLEETAKSKKDWRNYEAVPLYQSLIAADPGNEEGTFDLGQVFGSLKQTNNALTEFGRVLELDPQHRESIIAQERASLELSPQLQSNFDFFHQNGRDGLATIDRTRYGLAAIWPFGDENELVRLGFSRVLYKPDDDRELDGNILSARAQKKFLDSRLLVYGQANLEQFPDRIQTRVTYNAGLGYDVCDELHLRADTFLENVVENGESLRQDIYRLGLDAGADIHATRYWNLGGNYRFAYYSDVNHLQECLFYSGYSLTLPPKQLKLVGTVQYQSYSDQTVFRDPTQQSVIGAIHPYFAPSSYVFYEARVEWYHWLSRDYFTYSNQCWYSLQYGIAWDEKFNCYQDLRALLNYDVKPWLSVGGYAQGLLSQVYNSAAVGAFATFRFPCRLNLARPIGCSQ